MIRRPRAAYRAVLVLMAGSSLLGVRPAVAQDEAAGSTLGGYRGSAAASGLRALYNPEGLLPVAAPVDIGAPDALATIAAGPTTFARASVADPGDLLANPAAVLGLAEPSLSGSLPVYPYRVSATSSLGAPTAEVSPAPGLNARVRVDGQGSSAIATMPTVDAPAIATVGSLSARAETTLDGSTLRVHARSALSGVDVLGLVHIDSVVTELTATSTDGAPKLEGDTTITGASILGTPVVIDASGIRSASGSSVETPLVAAVNEVLLQLGIHLTVVSPVDAAGGGSGQISAAGLQLDIEFSERTAPSFRDLLDLVPPMDALVPGLPGIEDILAAARARHLARVGIGTAIVSMETTSVGDLPTDAGTDLGLPGYTGPADSSLVLDPISRPAAATSRPTAPTTRPTSVGFGQGVGGIALLVLLLQPLLGGQLARWATTLLAADHAGACPREGRS